MFDYAVLELAVRNTYYVYYTTPTLVKRSNEHRYIL